MATKREIISTAGAPEPVGPYSQGVASGDLLFCSGQIGLDPSTGVLVDGGVGAQARQCLENLSAVCHAAGTTLDQALRCTVYLTDLAGEWDEVNEVYATFFGSEPPARAAIGVSALPKGGAVEIDAIVAL